MAMAPSLLKRRMFSFRGNSAERKESVVRSSAWPSPDPVESESVDSLGDYLKDKGSAVKKDGLRDGDVVKHAQTKQAKDVFQHDCVADDDDDVLIKAMREESDEYDRMWLMEGDVDEEGIRGNSLDAVNVLPSFGAMEETLFTDTNSGSLIRLVRQLHEEDAEIDPSILLGYDDLEYYAQHTTVDTHSLLKAATASKLGDFEEKLECISKLLNKILSEQIPEEELKAQLAVLERRVGNLETAVTISMTNQDKRVSSLGQVIEALRAELDAVRKSYRIMDQKYDDVVNRLNALNVSVVLEEKDMYPPTHVKGVLIFLLKNIGVPLLTALIAHRHIAKKS